MSAMHKTRKHVFLSLIRLLMGVVFLGVAAVPARAAPPAHPGTVIVPPDKRPPGYNRPIRRPGKGRRKVHPATHAPEAPSGQFAPSAVPMSAVEVPAFSSSQTIRPLILLLSFADNAFSTTNAAAYPGFAFSDSPGLADYYREVSGGKLNVAGDVNSVYSVNMAAGGHSYRYYVPAGTSGVTGGYPNNSRGMVEDALGIADSANGVNFADFDNDGPDGVPRSGGSIDDDGLLDALIVVHAGPAAEYFGLAAAGNYMASHYDSFPTGQEWTADGVKAPDWAMVPETDPDDPGNWHYATYPMTLGTLAHEFGHVLGLPDLYDTTLGSYGLGHYDLMAYGMYGTKTDTDTYAGFNSTWNRPGHLSAWSRSYLGWVQPIAVHADTAFQIWRSEDPPGTVLDYPQVVKVWASSSWSPLAPWVPSEYFLFEHRQSDLAFYDYGFSTSQAGAVLVYHVDEDILFPGGVLNGTPNDDVSHKGVDLEEADGKNDLDNKANFGDFTDFYQKGYESFYNNSTPNSRSYAGSDTGVNIVHGFGPTSSATAPDYLMTVDMATDQGWIKNGIGYWGTDRAGPVTVVGGTFDDGDSDPWIRAGRPTTLDLTVRNSGIPNTLRGVTGLIDLSGLGTVTGSTVSYGDIAPLATTTGGGSFGFIFDQPSRAFSWMSIYVSFADTRDNFSQVEIPLPVMANSAPAGSPDSATVDEGSTVTVLDSTVASVLDNDTDADGDQLTASYVSGPSSASNFTLNPDGTFSYTHNGSETTTDSFTYQAYDGIAYSSTTTVSITVNPVNDVPVAAPDSATVDEGGTVTVLDSAAASVLANDTDVDSGSLTAILVAGPSNALGFTLNSDGTFTYKHNGSETVSDSFSYKANDGSADSNTVTVSITINPVNDSSSRGGPCFIATAAYGSPMAPKVDVFRGYRDRYLVKRAWGRALLRAYYALSPGPAHFIQDKPMLRSLARAMLYPVLRTVKAAGADSVLPVFAGFMIVILPFGAFLAVVFLPGRYIFHHGSQERARKFLG